MRLDHVSYAAGPDGLAATAARIGGLLGEHFTDGGIHPRFGTRNMVLALTPGTYVEVVASLDHPASDKAPFGQAVRARSALGGGWLGWVVAVEDIASAEARLGRASVAGNRWRPDGYELRWRQIGVRGLQADPQLPFFVQWDTYAEHPGGAPRGRSASTPWRSPATPGGSATGWASRSRRRWTTSCGVGGAQRHPRHRRGPVRTPSGAVRI